MICRDIWLKKYGVTPFKSEDYMSTTIKKKIFNKLIKNDMFKNKEQISYQELDNIYNWTSHNSFIRSHELAPAGIRLEGSWVVYFRYTFEDKYINFLNEDILKQLLLN